MQRDMLSITKPPRMSYVFLREKRQRKTEKQGAVTEKTERGLSKVLWPEELLLDHDIQGLLQCKGSDLELIRTMEADT